MKKKEGHASDRVSAMVLGGAICSRESGRYAGPLFARKKPNYLGRFFLFMFVVGVAVSFWDRGRKKVISVATGFLKSEGKAERALASEGAAENIEIEVPQTETRKEFHKNER